MLPRAPLNSLQSCSLPLERIAGSAGRIGEHMALAVLPGPWANVRPNQPRIKSIFMVGNTIFDQAVSSSAIRLFVKPSS